MKNSPTITRNRSILVLALVFFSTLAVYLVVYYFNPALATGVTVAWGITLLIGVMYLDRKRTELLGLENQYRELRAFINLQPMLNNTFLPYSFWAMEPSNILNLLATMQYQKYRTVVECGAGVSTLAIGKLLMQMGQGHVYSLEEDEHWYDVMCSAVAHEGLDDFVTILHAPLEHNAASGEQWYAAEATRRVLAQAGHVDVLLIDGPKSIAPLSRYPALPTFAPALDSASLIILDDSKRGNEKAVIKQWGETFDIEVEHLSATLRGQAYIRLRSNPLKQPSPDGSQSVAG